MDCLVFLLSFLVLISCNNIAVEPFDVQSIQEDLAKFNVTCYRDYCDTYGADSFYYRDCQCGIQCVQLGTCCINSKYVEFQQLELKLVCRSVYNYGSLFIVDKCSSDKPWAGLCNAEWNGESDLQKLVPVTSLLTSITYKNYFCFRCHETTDQFLYWTVKVESDHKTSEKKPEDLGERIVLTYFQNTGKWMAIYDEDIGYFEVKLTILPPDKIGHMPDNCGVPNVISDCSEKWSDEEIRSKCQSYMAIKQVTRNDSLKNEILKYKNIHCALCNYESLNDILCKMPFYPHISGRVFSFSLLLDINRSDGILVGKIKKCSEGDIWDPYTKQCRKLTCALPGFKVQNDKCVQQ